MYFTPEYGTGGFVCIFYKSKLSPDPTLGYQHDRPAGTTKCWLRVSTSHFHPKRDFRLFLQTFMPLVKTHQRPSHFCGNPFGASIQAKGVAILAVLLHLPPQ